jgi:hypothetical protein
MLNALFSMHMIVIFAAVCTLWQGSALETKVLQEKAPHGHIAQHNSMTLALENEPSKVIPGIKTAPAALAKSSHGERLACSGSDVFSVLQHLQEGMF